MTKSRPRSTRLTDSTRVGLSRIVATALASLVALAGSPSDANPDLRWVLDPSATEIRFEVAATLHRVRGTATLRRGELIFDPEGGAVRGEIVIDATSLDTGNERRDRKLHADVLESELYSDIVLRPLGLVGTVASSTSSITVDAELELHGARHPMRLEAEVARSEDAMQVTTRFEIPYVLWGLEDPSKAFLRVGKIVQVEISSSGSLETTAP